MIVADRGLGQRHVVLGDAAHAATHEAQLHVLALQLAQALGGRLERPLDVRLQDDVQRGGLAALDLLEEVLQARAGRRRRREVAREAEALLTRLAQGARRRQILGRPQLVARLGRLGEAEDLHRHGGQRLLHVVAAVVDQRLDLAPGRTRHHGVAHPQRALLDDDRRHRAPPGLEVRLQDRSAGPALGARHQLFDLGQDDQLLQELVDAGVLQRRDLDADRVAAPGLGHEAAVGDLLEHPRRIGVGPVDLVDGDHDRHVGGAGVVDGFQGLGHHAVVGRHHQHHDVGDIGPARPHGGERLVARGVDEREQVVAPGRPGRRRCAG